jgi:hypothetical protein
MRFTETFTAVLASLATSTIAVPNAVVNRNAGNGKPQNVDDFQALAMQALQDAEADRPDSGCSLANARVRRDWCVIVRETLHSHIYTDTLESAGRNCQNLRRKNTLLR